MGSRPDLAASRLHCLSGARTPAGCVCRLRAREARTARRSGVHRHPRATRRPDCRLGRRRSQRRLHPAARHLPEALDELVDRVDRSCSSARCTAASTPTRPCATLGLAPASPLTAREGGPTSSVCRASATLRPELRVHSRSTGGGCRLLSGPGPSLWARWSRVSVNRVPTRRTECVVSFVASNAGARWSAVRTVNRATCTDGLREHGAAGDGNILVMRRSGVRLPKAAPQVRASFEAPDHPSEPGSWPPGRLSVRSWPPRSAPAHVGGDRSPGSRAAPHA